VLAAQPGEYERDLNLPDAAPGKSPDMAESALLAEPEDIPTVSGGSKGAYAPGQG
jgi:hypothetical protein